MIINISISKIRSRVILLLLLFLVIFSIKDTGAQELNYKSQSLFIYKFTKHVTWPESYNKGDFVIGVYGNSPIYEELVLMASLKRAGNGQKIVIKKIRSIDEISNIHLLYIASSKSREIKSISAKIADKSTLIIAEREGLARKGATVNFMILENNVLKFEINMNRMRIQKLKISPDLLKLGYKVG